MAIRSSRGSSFGSWKQHRQDRVKRKRTAKREFLLEKLEERALLAVVGPQLAGIQPTDGELLPLDGSGVRSIAPRELIFRFDENQQIDPNTLNGIRIARSGLDGDFSNGLVDVTPGYIGVGAAPNQNEVIVRLAESLPDDLYRIELYGIDDTLRGITALRNTRGEAFGDLTDDRIDNGANQVIGFSLELAPQVLAVVPQPVTRVPNPANPLNTILQQSRDQIVVYFNDDGLFIEDDATGKPTQRSAENPEFYRLIYTRDSVKNTDDITFFPASVQYDPVADTATLHFAGDLDTLPIPSGPDAGTAIGPGTWRLRVGTDEELPLPPLSVRPAVQSSTDFGTGGAVSVLFTATGDFGKAVVLSFTESPLGAGVSPTVTVAENTIQVVLNADGTTAQQLADAVNGNSAAARLIATSVRSGDESKSIVGGGARSLRVLGLGSSYDTAYDFGELGGQSLLVSSSIDPQPFPLDLPGGQDEPGHRDIPTEVGSGFEQHINPNFGPDVQDGVTTIPYNFRQVYGYDAQGNPLSNLITEKQKTRAREAVEMWAKHLGIQFLETADLGLTFVTGDPRALDPNDPNVMNHALPTGASGFSDYDFIVRVDPSYVNGMIILDSNRQWNSDYGADWFQRIMVGLGAMLGLQRANDLPVTNLMAFDSSEPFVNSSGDNFGNFYFSNRSDRSDSAGSTFVSYSGDGFDSAPTSLFGSRPPEPIFPGNADILHGQYIHRPDSNDIDLFRFKIDLNDQQLDEKKKGLLTAESFAERLPNSSELDTVLSLYREVELRDANGQIVGYERELISRNDNYYSSDSYISLELGSGTYYLGVTAAGNTDFDPVIEDTGFGGTTQGVYELRLNFRSQVDDDDTISDLDRIDENRPGTPLDGDADGTPGGVFNFWFQTRPLDRVLRVTGDGNTYVDGQTMTIEDAFGNVRRFEFDRNGSLANPSATWIPFTTGLVPTSALAMANQLYNAINGSGLAVTATQDGTSITLKDERVALLSGSAVGIELDGKTIFVDKTSGTNLRGTLEKPFDNISTAFAATVPGDIVRIVGNGGSDGNRATLQDNFAYEIGAGASGGPSVLPDGSEMSVPQGVTAMIDAGAVFKLRRARIGVGSSSAGVDRSAGSLQVLGTPLERVYFTSWMDETIGRDTYAPTTTPTAGEWGGILFKADLDNADARFNYESEGIFLNYVSHADIRYGGGQVRIDNVDQVVNPIQMIEMRPTIAFNRITSSSDAAMSADPNSFEETNFLAPQYQLVNQFTPDYERIGPDIHGNILLQNSINGLFVRIQTPAGTELRSLSVPGRFNDIDIVHVLAENLKIQGEPGGALLETSRPPVELVTLAPQVGGSLPSGTYAYKLVFVDRNGFEGRPSEVTGSVTLTFGSGTVQLSGLPPVSGNFVARRLYRSQADGNGPFNLIAELDAVDAGYIDRGGVPSSPDISVLDRDPPSVLTTTLAALELPPTAPGVSPGTYAYRVVTVNSAGETGPASDPTSSIIVTSPATPGNILVVDLAGLPAVPPLGKLQIFRSSVGGAGTFVLAGEISSGTTFTDDGTVINGADGQPVALDPRLTGVVRARPDGRLKIDPGTVLKLEGARIEITFGAQLIAEGLDDRKIIFTSKLDDKYGAGGTFDTNKDDGPNEASPSPGDWGGLWAGPMGQLNLDQVYLAFGGGNNNKIEGTFTGFNVIEIHQADARIANSVIEQNALGTGGQGSAHRFGRGVNAGATMISGVRYDSGATIFVRGAQPVILNNTIRNNEDVAISINLDSFTAEQLSDPGRATGGIDQVTLYRDNRGPLIRGNQLADNGNQTDSAGNLVRNNNGNLLPDWRGTNGMEIRTAAVWNANTPADPRDDTLRPVGLTLSTESVWDDTDIVHILYDEVRVSNLHVEGGLRLQSSSNESLVVKISGPGVLNDAYNRNPTIGAGFTATGQPTDTADRIGGTVYVLGQPGFPVVLTSIHDDTVGAGVQPDGRPQKDTNNNRSRSTPQAGDWRSVRLDQNSHDRNVEIVLELSVPEEMAPGLNGIPSRAQFLGDLAPDEYSGDDNLRLGFEIQGFLNARNDVDYYSFTAEAGTEIWLDIDRTRYALDTVIDVLDASGRLIAQSDQSQEETGGDVWSSSAIADGDVNPLQKLNDTYQPHHASGLPKDIWGTNSRDAGLRIVLPGAAGGRSSYLFRVRTSNLDAGDSPADLQDETQLDQGLTSGLYRLQVRMRETDEVPGSTVRYADIRYAQNGVEVIGLPGHSPLLGEAAEDEGTDPLRAGNGTAFVDPLVPGQRPQELGNLFASDRVTLSVAGALSNALDVDFYRFDVTYENISNPSAHHGAVAFDIDYADGLSRPDTTIVVFRQISDNNIVPVLIGRDSNLADDRPEPVLPAGDRAGVWDLSRGSVGLFDPFIGSVELPEGTYYVAVVSDQMLPDVLSVPTVRLEPIDSVVRIADDHIGSSGGSTAADPIVSVLLDPAFDGTVISPQNLWHVSTLESNTQGHGLTPAFDGSRLGTNAGFVFELEANDAIASAQSLEGGLVWSLDFNADIGDFFGNTSTTIPHMTVTSRTSDNNDTFDYYSFVVTTVPARGIFDIDYGMKNDPLTDVDLDLVLFDSAGRWLDWGPSSLPSSGAGGSVSVSDGMIEYDFTVPGTYVIGVGGWPSFPANGGINGTPVPTGKSYVMQVSVENHPAVTTTGGGGQTFYFGQEATGDYDLGGLVPGGTLPSNPFSLQDYAAGDKPVAYFNYRLDADDGDYFRVYVRRSDGSSELIASSNSAEIRAGVVLLYNSNTWRQARMELDRFAGLADLRLEFEFQSADGVVNGRSGVHVDDVLIGFAERGEMITNGSNVTTFSQRSGYNTSGRVLSGAYQLEVRKAADFGTSVAAQDALGRFTDGLILQRSFDTNDRLAQQATLVAPSGATLTDAQTFQLGDGSGALTFEFDSNGLVSAGNVRVPFSPSDADYVIAARIRDAINSPSVQGLLDLQAGLSDGTNQGSASRSNLVNLFGNAVVTGGPAGFLILHDGIGDANLFRDQGQMLIHSNTITNSADFGIVADAGVREIDSRDGVFFTDSPPLGQSHIGPARNLLELNNRTGTGAAGGMTPGVTIVNNTISGEGLGGIHFSGNLRPYELVPPDNAGGELLCDGAAFSVTVGRTTVQFEFEDLSAHAVVGACPDNPLHGDGWTTGRVPIYYLMESEPVNTYIISQQTELAEAIADAITRSILVDNGTTLVAEANVGLSRTVGGYWAAYVDHAREVTVLPGPNPFTVTPRVVPIGQAAQPFGRIVNNTIVGNDGTASFFPDPVSEPNDTIFNAVDTRQGRQASPEFFRANNVRIGDGTSFPQNPDWDVDFYQFQMDIGDHVQITVTGNEFLPDWRLFNERGEEFIADGSGTARGVPRVTVNPTNPFAFTIDFYVDEPATARAGYNYAREGGTYFVAFSGSGNNAYSPLSLGGRQAPSATGIYSIDVNVLAPRKWLIDTQPLFGQAASWEVTDVDGNTATVNYTGTSDLRANTPLMANELRNLFRTLPLNGITAEDFGGPEFPHPSGINYTPVFSTPRQQWVGGQRNQGDGRRYVEIYGAAKIVRLSGPATALSPIVGQNNLDSQVLRETGVLISEEATPTLLNNVLSNLRNAVIETDNQPQGQQATGVSPRTAIVGSQIFQHSGAGNWNYSTIGGINPEESLTARPDTADFNLPLSNTAPLFVNAGGRNFFPAPLTAAIDSSVDSLEDRPQFITVKAAMGISNSPILAPARDVTGQLRIDDPKVSPPQGQGADVFKDRGSLDRSDFIGPAAVLLNPRDDDADGLDVDPTATVVQLATGSYDHFLIQIVDGYETADPYPGVGVNDATILGPNGPDGRLPGAAVTVFADGVFLEEGIDYTYRYDATRNTIRLTPTSGVWASDKVYVVRLNNRDRYVINAPTGSPDLDGTYFDISDDAGIRVRFEYDSGYSIQVPNSLAIQVPASGLSDSQRFVVRNANNPTNLPVTFELDVDGNVLQGNIRVPFVLGSTQDEIAAAIVAALRDTTAVAAGLQLSAKSVGGGRVHLGAPEGYTLNTELSNLGQPATILSLAVPAVTGNPSIADVFDTQTFTVTYTPATGPATTLRFEFDTSATPSVTPGNIRVAIPAGPVPPTPDFVADQIVTALRGTALGGLLQGLQHVGGGLIHIHQGDETSIDPETSRLYDGYVSQPVSDSPTVPEVFVVSFDHDANTATPPVQVRFELDRDGTTQPGNVVIPFSYGDTHEEVGQKIALAIATTLALDLPDAKQLEDGLVFLGGTIQHNVDLTNSPSLLLRSEPFVTPTTRLLLPPVLTITVPAAGGAAIADGDVFQIFDNSLSPTDRMLQFEFNSAGGATDPASDQLITFSPLDTADTIAQAIKTAIENVVLPGYNAGAVLRPTLGASGSVLLAGANGYHSLDTARAPTLIPSGGRLADGETFSIEYNGVTRVFEYDSVGGVSSPTHAPILFTVTSDNDQIAASTVAAIKSQPLLGLPNVQYVGQGAIELHDTSRHITTLPADSFPVQNSLSLTGIPGGAIRLPFEPWSQFTGEMFAEVIVDAINNSPLTQTTASLRGGNTLFVDFLTSANQPVDYVAGLTNITGVSNYFLRAIQDLPGNWLKANQYTGQTRFTIIMPGAELDFGDARVPNRPSQYPTLFDEDGARHVVADGWYLGRRVDGEFQAQIVPGGFGDDVDQRVDLRDSTLTLAGNAPLTVQLPNVANPSGALDTKYFDIIAAKGVTTRFEFDQGANGVVGDSRPVVYNAGATLPQIADALVLAIEAANLGLTPGHLGGGTVFLGGMQLQRIDTTSSHVTVAGLPPYQIHVNASLGSQIQDGETLTISDGVDVVPWIFEFDHNGTVAAGNFAVTLLPGDDARTVAQKLRSAVVAAERLLPTPHNPAVTLTDLNDGSLHVRGALSHSVDFQTSTMTYAGQTPVTLTVPAAGLGFKLTPSLKILVDNSTGGGVADGQRFTLRDGVNTVVFEFDTNGSWSSGTRRVAINALSPAATVAEAIRAAVQSAVDQGALLGLAPVVDAASDPSYLLIDLGAGIAHSLDASASGLGQRTAVQDGWTFQVVDSASPQNIVTFEFDLDGSSGAVAVPVQPSFSANDIANAMVTAVQESIDDSGGLDNDSVSLPARLMPKNLGSGNIQIGGFGAVNAAGSHGALSALGSPGGVLDGHTFHLIDSLGVRRFEFDANGQATQGNITVGFQVTSTGADIADAMVTAMRASGFAVNMVHLSGGVIALDGDDEDGVRFDSPLTPGAVVPITVTASRDGYLDGWLDLNGDGDWNAPNEHIFNRVPVYAGANQLTFSIPSATGPGVTYARFRFGSEGGLAPTGLAIDGEVEDYRVEIIDNDPPAIVAPTQLATGEDVPLTISGLQIVDPDAGLATIEVTLSVLQGRLAVWPTFLPGDGIPPNSGINGNNTARVVLRGTLAQINNTLAYPSGLVYENDPLHYNGTDRLTIVVDDLGNSGTGGPQQAVALVPITVGPVNDAPTISIPGPQAATEDEPLLINGISIDDVDLAEINSAGSGTGQIRVTLSATRGTLDVAQAAAANVTVTNDQTASVTLLGPLADINIMLAAGVTYLGLSELNGTDVVTVTANDLGNWPAPPQTTSDSFDVVVAAVNDPPAITAPPTADAEEDTQLPLSGFDLEDVDSAATPITVTLTVTSRNDGQLPNGTLTIKPVAGGVDPFGAQVIGNNSSLVTITAPVDQIAATLSDPNGWVYLPPGNFAGNAGNPKYEILTITANDGGASGDTSPDGTTDMRQVTLYVSEVNDSPVVTVPTSPAVVLEDQVLDIRSLGDIEITDADAGNAAISVQLSVGRGTITLNPLVPGAPTIVGNGTSQVNLSGTLAAINALLDSFVNYQGALNANGQDILTILANDLGNTGGPAASGVGRVTITITADNDAPQVSLPADLSVNEDTDLRIPAIVIADPDVTEGGADGVITVTLAVAPIAPNAQAGTLTVNTAVVPALTVTGSPGGNITVLGRLIDINTMLAHPDGLKYRGAPNASGQALFSITANDEGKSPTPAQSTTATLTIAVRPVNDEPVITVPGAQAVVEDQPTLIAGISITDVDITETTSDPAGTGSGQMTVTLSAGRGTIDVNQAVAPGVAVTNDVSQSVTLNGSLIAINTLLGAGITYQGLTNLNGADTVTITANDLGNWPPPVRISTATIAVTVAKVNDPPVVTAPGEQFLNEDPAPTLPYYISGIAVADVDVNEGTGQLKVDLRVTHGTLTVDLTVAGGLRATNVTGNGTGFITIDNAGPSQINATLAALTGLKYQPTLNYNGLDALTISADDKGNSGGVVSATTATVPITVVAVNDPPQLPWTVAPAVPPTPLTEEDTANFVVWPANAVVDVDVSETPGDGRLTVTLSAGHGTITVSTNFGLAPGDFGSGNTGTTVQFTAPLAAINATLSAATGVSYLPNHNYNGKDTVVMTVNDRGNTDAGLVNPLTAQGTVTVTVVAVNDPPVLTVPAASVTVAEDTNLPIQAQVADVDAAEGTGELRMTLQVFFGTLTVSTAIPGGISNVIGNGGTAVSLIGTPQQLNATFAANGVVYRGNPNFYTTTPGEETLLIRVEDEVGGVINTGPIKGTDSKTVTINITPVNDAPTIQIVAPNQIIEDTAAPLPILVNDAEINDNTVIWTATLHADLGIFTVLAGVPGGVPLAGITGSPSGDVVLQGTGRQIQTTLGAANGVLFQGAPDFDGTDILTVTIQDPGPPGATPPDPRTSQSTLTFTVTAVNDAPQIALPAGLTTPEDVPLILTGSQALSVTDVDSRAANISVVLQVTNGRLTIGGTVPGNLSVAGSGTNKVTLVGPVNSIAAVLADPNGVTYRSNLNYFGNDMLSVSADDRGNTGSGGALTAAAFTQIVVTLVNDPPTVANPVADFSVDEDSPNTLIELFPGVFADPDNTTLTLTVTGNSDPSLVTAAITGTRLTLSYLPNQSGRSATIRVRASDGPSFVEDEFIVTVNPQPDAPVVANPVPDQVVQVGSTTTITVNLTGVFSDPDLPNDTLTLSYNNATGNTNPNLVTGGSLNPSTSILTLQLGAGAFGRADITVRATDSTNRTVTDTFTVIVNSLPTARDDTATTKEDVQVGINVIANDSDTDGAIDPASVTLVPGSGPSHGQIVSVSNGTVTYKPDANYSGPDSFRYTVKDNDGFESAPATVSITVQSVPDYQNPAVFADVNRSGQVTPIDALIVINYINSHPTGALPPDPTPPATPEFYYDVNGDGKCDAQDVLIIVNILNSAALSGAEGESAVLPLESTSLSEPAQIADAGLSAMMLAVPDFTLLKRTTAAVAGAARPATGNLSPTVRSDDLAWTDAAESKQDAWFERIGGDASELLDVTLADALNEMASGVDAGFGETLAADLALSGLKGKA